MPNILEKGAPLPVSLGRCADLLYDVKQLRLAMQKQVDAIDAREKEINEHLINAFGVDDPGAVGTHHMARVTVKKKYRIADWGVFCSWVRKNDRFDCLQKRLSDEAVETTIADEARVLPGLEAVNAKSISLTKV